MGCIHSNKDSEYSTSNQRKEMNKVGLLTVSINNLKINARGRSCEQSAKYVLKVVLSNQTFEIPVGWEQKFSENNQKIQFILNRSQPAHRVIVFELWKSSNTKRLDVAFGYLYLEQEIQEHNEEVERKVGLNFLKSAAGFMQTSLKFKELDFNEYKIELQHFIVRAYDKKMRNFRVRVTVGQQVYQNQILRFKKLQSWSWKRPQMKFRVPRCVSKAILELVVKNGNTDELLNHTQVKITDIKASKPIRISQEVKINRYINGQLVICFKKLKNNIVQNSLNPELRNLPQVQCIPEVEEEMSAVPPSIKLIKVIDKNNDNEQCFKKTHPTSRTSHINPRKYGKNLREFSFEKEDDLKGSRPHEIDGTTMMKKKSQPTQAVIKSLAALNNSSRRKKSLNLKFGEPLLS